MESDGPPSLEDIRAKVHAKVPSGSMFRVLNTRLIIQTGVDLEAIRADQTHDPMLRTRVAEALARMGITFGHNPS